MTTTKWIILGTLTLGLIIYSFSPRWERKHGEEIDFEEELRGDK